MISAFRPLARLTTVLVLSAAATWAVETLGLTVPSTTLAVNGQVVVTVTLNGANPFSVWGECLTWDNTKLQLVSQDLTSSAFGQVVNDSRSVSDINASAQVRTGGYYQAAGLTYPDNSGGSNQLATFTFQRIAAGSTVLTARIKDATYLFGAVMITAAGVERTPSANATLTFTDPVQGTGPGDLDGNRVVNIADLTLVTSNFGKTSADSTWVPGADANADGIVNISDLTLVTSNFARTY